MLISAVLTAVVGVLLKQSKDKLVLRSILSWGSALIVLPFAFFLPLPPNEAWPYLVIGAVVHFIYQVTLVAAFERGDMSMVFPIARGVAPAIAAIFAFLILGEVLGPIELLGLGIVVFALMGFGWPSNSSSHHVPAVIFALICGSMIALYSVIDAGGMRVSSGILDQMWTYIVWFFIFDAIGLPLLVMWLRRGRFRAALKPEIKFGVLSAMLSVMGFGLALYAFSIAPVAKMSAVRETSVVFGAALAVIFLKESFGIRRIVLACIMALGLMMMQFSA